MLSSRQTRILLGSATLAVAVAVALVLLRGESYWNYSDGVYAYTARAVLGGDSLYSEIAAAQPPFVYLSGSLLLAVSDSVMGLRLGLGLVEAVTAVLAAAAILRLTGSRTAAVLGSLLTLLAPRTLHDFANLLPETLGAPLLLGMVLAASSRRWCLAAGVLAAVAVFTKLPFVLPVAAVFLVAKDRRRFARGAAVAALVLLALFTAVYGTVFLEGVLLAQSGSGLVDGGLLGREVLQAAWNLVPLAILAGVGVRFGTGTRDRALHRPVMAAAAGSLLIFGTLVKHGAYINLVVVAEPFLVILAVCGTTEAVRQARARLWTLALATLCWIAFFAQAVSLVVTPGAPEAFAWPFDRSNHGQFASAGEVRAGARALAADHCDRSRPYYSSPFMAFAADIRLPGNQGDPFIIRVSDVYRTQRELAAREACR